MNREITIWILALGTSFATGCGRVDVTKTAPRSFPPTRAEDIEILMTLPLFQYTELATASTTKWKPKETVKMHNAMRAKTAPLGANAIVIMESGIVVIRNKQYMWTNGFALRYRDDAE